MAFLEFKDARIVGISAAVPLQKFSNLHPDNQTHFSSDYSPEDFVASTGVEEGRETKTLTTSDLCFEAAEQHDAMFCMHFAEPTGIEPGVLCL